MTRFALLALCAAGFIARPAFADDELPKGADLPPSPPPGKQVGPDDDKPSGGMGGSQVGADSPKQEEYHSPQHFAIEMKAGPYSPAIDSTPGLTGTPFSDLYNKQYAGLKGKQPGDQPLFALELDYQILHGFGSLGLGGTIGAYSRSTHSLAYLDPKAMPPIPCVTSNSPSVGGCTRSSDESTLTILPFSLELVYRLDIFALKYKIPIVPYLKGGIAYYFWFNQKGDGSLSQSLPDAKGNTSAAIGGTFGLVAHPGVALMLDVFDQAAARTLDADLGINHTYLFVELNYAWITGLGFKDKIVFSDTSWNAGVAFEF